MTTVTTFLPATVTIQDLPVASTIFGTELIEAVQTSSGVANSVQITATQIAALAATTKVLAGSGISVATTATTATVTWAPGTSVVAGNALSVSTTATTVTVAWAPGTTILPGSGISVGTSATAATITWAPGTSVVAGSGIAVTTTATTVSVALASVAGLSVLANAAVASAVPAPIVGGANQLVVVNNAATTVLFQSLQTTIDLAIGSSQGAIIYRNATSWVPLAAATSSLFLQTKGAAANPVWAQGAVLLNTLTPSAIGSTSDTTSITSLYNSYLFSFYNVYPSVTTATFEMKLASTGTTFVGAGYVSQAQFIVNGTAAIDTSTSVLLISGTRSTTQISTSTGAAISGLNGFIVGNSLSDTAAAAFKQFNGQVSFFNSSAQGTSTLVMGNLVGVSAFTHAVTGVSFLFSSGNIQTGTIRIYGIP